VSFEGVLQTESRQIECQMSEIGVLISLASAEGGIDVGDPMLKIEKCCEGVRAPPTPQKSENQFRLFGIPSVETQSVDVFMSLRVPGRTVSRRGLLESFGE